MNAEPDRTKAIGVTSLFSGCGGLDLGFARNGFFIDQAFDRDQQAVQCYNENHRSSAQQYEIDESFGKSIPSEIIVAGPPCQGFSTGGGYREADPRNDLLITTCKIAVHAAPKLIVIENVSALTNTRNRAYFLTALNVLTDAGYYVDWSLLAADDFGVPQRRKRIVIIARSEGRTFTGVAPPKKTRVVLGDVLLNIPSDAKNHLPQILPPQSRHATIARHIKPGQKLCNVRAGSASVPTWAIPDCFGQTAQIEQNILETIRSLRRQSRTRTWGDADPVSLSTILQALPEATEADIMHLLSTGFLRKVGEKIDIKNTFNGKYRRLKMDELSPTVDTRFGDVQLFLHPTEDRSLTVREAARIQGFPDDFVFPEADKVAFRLIGNAVPPPLAESVSEMCRSLL